jgi:hypothetical protein
MFNLSSVRVVLTLVAMIYDVLNLIAQFVMIYIMVLIWKLPNISTNIYLCIDTLCILKRKMNSNLRWRSKF